MKDNNISKKSNGMQILIVCAIVILIAVVGVDLVMNYLPIGDDSSSPIINNVTKKEVTVTDEGIADAVEKLYDASVIVIVETSQGTGWGSGVVYKTDDKDAYILTNHHVIDGAKKITVEFSDGSDVTGTLIGSDSYADIAVLKVPKDKILSVAEIGKSEVLRVGDTVFAIGTPESLEYAFTVTRGILSGKNRLVEMTDSSSGYGSIFGNNTADTWYMNLLQIDAPINRGNSGGPLANCNGEVVGITNSKLSNSYSSSSSASIENIGFAIPIEDALSVAELIESGTADNSKKPTLGISMTTVDGASYNGITLPDSIKKGAVVAEVMDDSNASRAGLKKGDVIIKFNNNDIEDYRHLKYYLYKCKIGDKVSVTYIRDDKEKTTEITLKD